MNDDPSGTAMQALPNLPLSLSVPLLLLFFLLGALFAMCESAVNSANESRVKRDAENGSRRAKKFLAYLEANESFASPLQFGMMLMGFFAVGTAVLGYGVYFFDLLCKKLIPMAAAPLSALICVLLCAALFLILADFIPKKFVAHKAVRSMKYSYKLVKITQSV